MLEIPPLPATTILLVEVGSTAHGTGIPGGEDHDELGIVVETPEEVVGLDEVGFATVMQRTQPEGARSGSGDVDRTLYSLSRFVRLAASGNPSLLMSFWAPVEHITPEGEELRALGGAFVGRHVIPRYRGYMQSQAMRLLGLRGGGHGLRGGGRREELIATHGYDTKYAMHCARLGFQCLELLAPDASACPSKGSRPPGCEPSVTARCRSTTGGPAAWSSTPSSKPYRATSSCRSARTDPASRLAGGGPPEGLEPTRGLMTEALPVTSTHPGTQSVP